MLAILVESKMAGFEPFLLLKVAVLFLVSTSSCGYKHRVKPTDMPESLCSNRSSVCAGMGTVKVLWTTLTTTTDSATSAENTTFLFLPGDHVLTNSTLFSIFS